MGPDTPQRTGPSEVCLQVCKGDTEDKAGNVAGQGEVGVLPGVF